MQAGDDRDDDDGEAARDLKVARHALVMMLASEGPQTRPNVR